MISRVWRALLTAAPVRFWAMVGAAVALTFIAIWMVWIVWHGGWPLAQAPRQLDIIGKALWLVLGMILLIVLALTLQRLSASGVWGRVDVGAGEPDPGVTKVTTETTITPGASNGGH